MGGGLYQHLMSTRMLTLKMNNALMNSENHQANGCMHDLDLLIISHWLFVSYAMRSGCKGKSTQVTYVYVGHKNNDMFT